MCPLRKAGHFFVSLWGLLFVLSWPAQEHYRGYLFMETTLVWAGIIFLYVIGVRLVEFWYWVEDED